MKHYTVEFKLARSGQVNRVFVVAKSKAGAWNKAVFDEIPKITGEQAYSAWVTSVTYQNGNHRNFNNFEGNPY